MKNTVRYISIVKYWTAKINSFKFLKFDSYLIIFNSNKNKRLTKNNKSNQQLNRSFSRKTSLHNNQQEESPTCKEKVKFTSHQVQTFLQISRFPWFTHQPRYLLWRWLYFFHWCTFGQKETHKTILQKNPQLKSKERKERYSCLQKKGWRQLQCILYWHFKLWRRTHRY